MAEAGGPQAAAPDSGTPDADARPRSVARPLRDSGSERSWGFPAIVLAVLVAAGAILLGPNLFSPPPAAASPTPAASPDPHIVASALGTFEVSIDYADEAFVVSRTDSGSPVEIGRAVVDPGGPQLETGRPTNGAFGFSMACPGATGSQPIRIVFGALFPATGVQYLGPAASWSIAGDGLFLIVLNPGFVDPSAEIRMSTRSASIGVDVSSFDYDLNSGAVQPSGCHVA